MLVSVLGMRAEVVAGGGGGFRETHALEGIPDRPTSLACRPVSGLPHLVFGRHVARTTPPERRGALLVNLSGS